jgi:hypothetical protein
LSPKSNKPIKLPRASFLRLVKREREISYLSPKEVINKAAAISMVASKEPLVVTGGRSRSRSGGSRRGTTRGLSKIDPDEAKQDGNDSNYDSLCDVKNGKWICKPYKQEIIAQQIENSLPGADRRKAVIGALRDLGVEVFIIEGKSITSTTDILFHVKRIVGFVAAKNRTKFRDGPLGFQRCMLYLDQEGRLFNLLLVNHAVRVYKPWWPLWSCVGLCRVPCRTNNWNNSSRRFYRSFSVSSLLKNSVYHGSTRV